MSKPMLARLDLRRHSKAVTATAVGAALTLLVFTQGVGSASAQSQTSAGNGWDCAKGTACLWNNVQKDGNTAEKLVVTLADGDVPDMEVPSPLGRNGVVHSTFPFHDNISLGSNQMAWDLCMMDTQSLGNGEYENNGAIVVLPANGGQFSAGYKEAYNDVFDTYTTARPGQCPSHVRFKGDNSAVIETNPAGTSLRAEFTDQCVQTVPTACLWVDGQGAGNNKQMAMITSSDGKPDLLNNTLRNLAPQFSDNISVGFNGLQADVCLYASGPDDTSQDANRWLTNKFLSVPSGTSFAQLADYNDVFDHFTTANPGQCPPSLAFDYTTGQIIGPVSTS